MTAREMFEALGYEEQFKGSDIYRNKKDGSRIAFDDYNGGNIDVVELSYIPRELLKAINMRCKELGWLEEEKQEIKQETNFDHYKDRILDCCIDHLAVVKGIPKSCSKIDCNVCDFLTIQKDCHEIAKEWLKQPYKKLTYKLTQCEYDMLDTIFEKEARFSKVYLIGELKKKGYFENIKCHSNVRVKDILENCEVVG